MKYNLTDLTCAIETLLRDNKKHSVVVFQHSKDLRNTQRVKATKKDDNTIVISLGKPNYSERKYIKKLKDIKMDLPRIICKLYKK